MPPSVTGIETETALDAAIRSTVLLRLERLWRSEDFPTWGTAFFVHPDGYLLTNWHVVAEELRFTDRSGDEHELPTKIVGLTAILSSGTTAERELPARVISRDRARDLALLKVDAAASSWIPIESATVPELTDEVWIVGFPFGDFLATERWFEPESEANPEVSVNQGRITSLRRNERGALEVIQTDAAVNPGNSGGPLLDYRARVIGVIQAKIVGGEGIGFAIPAATVRAFLDARAFQVAFEPRMIHPALDSLTVSIDPLLARLEGRRGTITLEGDDLRSTSASFVGTESGLQAVLELPSRTAGIATPDHYFATIVFRGGKGPDIRRRFRLRSTAAAPSLSSHRDPAKVLDDRRFMANELDLSKYADARKKSGSSLSDGAGDIKLKRSESGSIVIDDHSVQAFEAPDLSTSTYRELESEELRAVAAQYDLLRRDLCSYQGSGTGTLPPLRRYWWFSDAQWAEQQRRYSAAKRYLNERTQYVTAIRNQATQLHDRLRAAGAGLCGDGAWRQGRSRHECGLPSVGDCP
jgi:S1-C subfamily serine protease